MDIRQFQELIKMVMETARKQDNRIDVTILRNTFAKMEISDVQLKEIMAYLAANQITVEGIPDTIKEPERVSAPKGVTAHEAEATAEMNGEKEIRKDKPSYVPKEINSKDSIYLQQYLEELKSIGKVSPQEEEQLSVRMKKGDSAAKERFINSNLIKVAGIAGEYKNLGMTLEDLIQEGNIALIQAVEKLPVVDDPETREKYINGYIRKGILDSLRLQQESDRFEKKVMERSNKIYLAMKEYEEKEDRKPDMHELEEETGLSEEEILDILELMADNMGFNDRHKHKS